MSSFGKTRAWELEADRGQTREERRRLLGVVDEQRQGVGRRRAAAALSVLYRCRAAAIDSREPQR